MTRSYDAVMLRLANLLGALSVAVGDELRERVAVDGLSASDAAAVNVVGHAPGCSVGYLAGALGLTHAGAVRVADRLTRAGLAIRAEGPDLRTVGLRLTAAGERSWAQVRQARAAHLDALLADVAPAERAALERTVEHLLAALTHDDVVAERICRLCDEDACPQDRCPVTCAVAT